MDTSHPALIEAGSSRKALPPTKRQHRSPELKRQIVEETLAPGASVARVARAHGVNANQVFAWRRQYRQGLLKVGKGSMPGLLAVRVAQVGGGRKEAPRSRTLSGMIQVDLPKGQLRLRGPVDREALRRPPTRVGRRGQSEPANGRSVPFPVVRGIPFYGQGGQKCRNRLFRFRRTLFPCPDRAN